MTVAVHDSDTTKAAPTIHGRRSGTTKLCRRAFLRTGGALRQFYAKLAVTLSKATAIGRASSAALVTVTSEPVTANVVGAVGSVSHSWTRTAPDAQTWTINNPTSATTTFSTDCDQSEEFSATFIDTVTDQAGQVLASDAVTVDCANNYYGGGYLGSAPPAPGRQYP